MPGSRAAPVYAVLVNTNGWRDTIECLESLLRSDYEELRIIVCDNASSDGSVERICEWAAGVLQVRPTSDAMAHLINPAIQKPVGLAVLPRDELESGGVIDWGKTDVAVVNCGTNLGFTGANNVGLRYVLSREPQAYAWVLNNDTVVSPRALSAMVRQAQADSGIGAVGATLLQYYQRDVIDTVAGATVVAWNGMSRLIQRGSRRSSMRSPPKRMDYISGCCILLPRATLDAVGLMDERFFIYCEDADWGARMRAGNVRLAHCPEAEVWHKGGATAIHRSEFHDYHNVKSVLHYVRKHRPRMLRAAMAYLAMRFLLPKILRGEWGRLRAARRGYGDFVREARAAGRSQPKVFASGAAARAR